MKEDAAAFAVVDSNYVLAGPRFYIPADTSRYYGAASRLKRFADVVGAALLILLTAPLMAVIAVLVKRSSPGPVLFVHACTLAPCSRWATARRPPCPGATLQLHYHLLPTSASGGPQSADPCAPERPSNYAELSLSCFRRTTVRRPPCPQRDPPTTQPRPPYLRFERTTVRHSPLHLTPASSESILAPQHR